MFGLFLGLWRELAHKQLTKQNRRLVEVVCSARFGGLKRIRTAVRGFADLCLATRPSDHFTGFGLQIYKHLSNLQNLFSLSAKNYCFYCSFSSQADLFLLEKERWAERILARPISRYRIISKSARRSPCRSPGVGCCRRILDPRQPQKSEYLVLYKA